MIRTAVYPGSFDPITLGHLDIIHRAAKLFDRVVVTVAVNPQKKPSFSPEERVDLISRATQGMENVEVQICSTLIVDFARSIGAVAIVKGLRALTDFDYEFQMALVNRNISQEIETLFLTTSAEYMFLSSSAVKQVAYYGGDISHFIPECICGDIQKRLHANSAEQ